MNAPIVPFHEAPNLRAPHARAQDKVSDLPHKHQQTSDDHDLPSHRVFWTHP